MLPPDELDGLIPREEEGPEGAGGEEWKTRSVPLGLAIFLLIITVAAALGIAGSVDRLLEEEEAALSAWNGVRVAAARRHDVLARLSGQLLRSGGPPEAVEAWRKARERFEAARSLEEEIHRLPALDRAADELGRVLREHRETLGPQAGSELERLREAEGERRIARRAFNETAGGFRTTLSRIPTRWLGGLMGFEPLPDYPEVSTPSAGPEG